MSRTNIDIDDDLVERAMRRFHLDSKRAAIQLALEQLVGGRMTKEEALAMRGRGFPLSNGQIEGYIPIDTSLPEDQRYDDGGEEYP